MTCPCCGKWAPPDPETGYNGDDPCSRECAEAYEQDEILKADDGDHDVDRGDGQHDLCGPVTNSQTKGP